MNQRLQATESRDEALRATFRMVRSHGLRMLAIVIIAGLATAALQNAMTIASGELREWISGSRIEQAITRDGAASSAHMRVLLTDSQAALLAMLLVPLTVVYVLGLLLVIFGVISFSSLLSAREKMPFLRNAQFREHISQMLSLFGRIFFESFAWLPIAGILIGAYSPESVRGLLIGLEMAGFFLLLACGPRFIMAPLFLLRENETAAQSICRSKEDTHGYWWSIVGNIAAVGIGTVILRETLMLSLYGVPGFMGGMVRSIAGAITFHAAIVFVTVFIVEFSKKIADKLQASKILELTVASVEGVTSAGLVQHQ